MYQDSNEDIPLTCSNDFPNRVISTAGTMSVSQICPLHIFLFLIMGIHELGPCSDGPIYIYQWTHKCKKNVARVSKSKEKLK